MNKSLGVQNCLESVWYSAKRWLTIFAYRFRRKHSELGTNIIGERDLGWSRVGIRGSLPIVDEWFLNRLSFQVQCREELRLGREAMVLIPDIVVDNDPYKSVHWRRSAIG